MSYACAHMTHVQGPQMLTYDKYAYERVRNAYDNTYDKFMRTTKSRNVRQYSYACRTRTQESRTTTVRTGPKNVVRYLYVSCTQFLRKMSVYWAHKNHTKCHQHKNVRTLSVRHTYDYTACRTGAVRMSYVSLLLPWPQGQHVHQSLQLLRPR